MSSNLFDKGLPICQLAAPEVGRPLRVYLASTSKAIGARLAQESEKGVEQLVYYVSWQLSNLEIKYLEAERNFLALVCASQRLRHYFLAHKLHLVVKSDPLKYLLTRPILSWRLARWLLQLSEFDITCTTPTAVKNQAVIDMMTQFGRGDGSNLDNGITGDLPEGLCSAEIEEF